MLRHRVAVPELPARYCDRPALTDRCALTRRRITVLAAPGGFGKTTVLAAACRAEATRGVPVASPHFSPGAVMIAEGFGPVYTRARARARDREHSGAYG